MDAAKMFGDEGNGGRVLVVDDNDATRAMHCAMLSKRFDVVAAASGEEAIEICRAQLPDLILLDIEMPGMDGVETCRRLREDSTVPVIFATAHESFEEHVRAYEAGGNDIVIKPVNFDVLVRKVVLSMRQHRNEAKLTEERQHYQAMAMSFLSSMGESGILLNFMRESIGCRSHFDLAQKLFDCIASLGVEAIVRIKHGDDMTVITPQGQPTPLEQSILKQAAGMGRIFQFKRRLVVNYPHVSIMISNMPDEATHADQAGKIRDNVAILAETTEGLCENVDMRIESMRRAEKMQVALSGGVAAVEGLRSKYLAMMASSRLQLQIMVDKMDRSFAWLGATQSEERRISAELDESVQLILATLAEGGEFEQDFGNVLDALRGETGQAEIELF